MIEYIIGLVICIFLFMWYMGMFHKMIINEDKFKGGYFIYKDF
jgi:hypothetical protein